MAPIILVVIALLALTVWRFLFTALRLRPSVRAIALQQRRHNNPLEDGPRISDTRDADKLDRQDRAKSYLRRIAALTCATQMDDAYVLDVGTMRFQVRDRHVSRLRDMTDPKCASEKTCFYLVHKGIPKEEEIATALLQLASNPALFDKWAVRNELAIKADGQVFEGTR
jgi:hypothetical protein